MYYKSPLRQGPLNRAQWEDVLSEIAAHLEHTSTLVLIGSAVGIFAGQPSRASIDLDVWRPRGSGLTSIDLDVLQRGSQFAHNDLKQACIKAGVMFNPTGELTGDIPYIQLVEEGIVQVGSYKQTAEIACFSSSKDPAQLRVSRPPIANIIASKLLRSQPKDLEDIVFLMSKYQPTRSDIEEVINSFPIKYRETAQENLIYLNVFRAYQGIER